MSNPTSNFGWQMPTNTDLVTNLPADFEVFGQAVDSDFADLKGGTSGQILSKNSNTDLDFVWVDNQVGDITSITATTPLTGGGTGGDVTVGIQAASTSQSGAVQLTDSTSSTSTTTAATPNSVKSTYDLATTANTTAGNAIAKSTVTTAGDIIYRNSTVPTRLGIGTAGQILTVNSGATAPEWQTLSAGGMTLLSTTTLSSTSTTISISGSGYTNLQIVVSGMTTTANNDYPRMDLNGVSGAVYLSGTQGASTVASTNLYWCTGAHEMLKTGGNNVWVVNVYNNASTSYYKALQSFSYGKNYASADVASNQGGAFLSNSAISSVTITTISGNTFTAGQVKIYGVK